MRLWEFISIGMISLLSNKLRSILSVLGIVIGVGSVIAILSIGKAGESALKQQFSNPLSTLEILYRPSEEDLHYQQLSIEKSHFTDKDRSELEKIPEIKKVIVTNSTTTKLELNQHSLTAQLYGIEENYYDISPLTMISGRFLTYEEMKQGRKVAIVNKQTANKLKQDVLGRVIVLDGVSFKIVGVFENRSKNFFEDLNVVLVPRTAWPMMYGENEIGSLYIQAKDRSQLYQVGTKSVDFLNKKYRKDKNFKGEFYIINMQEIQKSLSAISNVMTVILSCIAGISLAVGGIGVMNMMLVSVTERTREIGIRKSLGATREAILLQFLIEAAILTTVGGIIGMGFGFSIAALVSLLAGWPIGINAAIMTGGLLFSMAIGIAFGLLPANKAAKCEPIESLRYE